MSSEALKEVEAALEQYKSEVNSTNMSETTKHTYILHSENFVRETLHKFCIHSLID
jgi:hypothetical protein